MGLKLNKLLAYSMDFVSFLLENIETDNIENIILFGSVAREESTKESDIDIFIDILNSESYYKDTVQKIEDKFFKSYRFLNYWKLKGIENNFNIIIGKLNQWKELKNSIISNGITLYSKFKEYPEKGEHKVLFSFEKIKPESKRVTLFKNLFGYKKNNKKYQGLLQKYNGIRIGSGSIMVPSESYNIFHKLFKKYLIKVKIIKLVEYE